MRTSPAPRALAACGMLPFAEVLELATDELRAHLAPRLHQRWHQLTALLERTRSEGFTDEISERWDREQDAADDAWTRAQEMFLDPDEWTVETAVGDHFLGRGTEFYAQALEQLRTDPEDDRALDELAEGMFYLLAVQTWKECHDED